MTTYDPWTDLRSRQDVTFGVTRLPRGAGWWFRDLRAVVLDDRIGRVRRRCVLAHELWHAEADDDNCVSDSPDGARIMLRRERLADLVAARRLIPLAALIDALRWSNRDEEVAEQLDVDLDTLRCRSANLTSDECVAIDAALYDEFRSA